MDANEPEHEDDKKIRLAAIERSRKNAPEFLKKHRKEIDSLITVFDEESAEKILFALRDKFWSMD